MRRRLAGRVVVVVVVGALSAAAVVTPAGAQEGEPGAEVTVNQGRNGLSFSALGCNFAPASPVRITFSGGGGREREFSKRVRDDTCFVWAPPDLDPCRLGASDLPGTQFRVTVDVPSAPYSLDQFVTLDPDTTKPRFLAPPFDASPRPGSKVEVGDEINVEVTATDKTPAPSWQTGVHSLQVTGPQGLLGSKDGGRLPQACGDKSKSLTVRGSHRVKRSDPPVIELCAITEDYVPNTNTKCARWYKGEVWEGTISGGFQFPGCTPGTLSGDVTVAVRDGSLTGEATYRVSPVSCGGPPTGEFDLGRDLGGTKTRDRFEIDFGVGGVLTAELEIDDGRASGLLVYSGPNPEFSYEGNAGSVQEITLECVSCGDEAVG